MSTQFLMRSMDVVALEDGRFGVRIIEPDVLSRIVGEFDTREEADAWILRQSMLGDEAGAAYNLLKPGPSLNVV